MLTIANIYSIQGNLEMRNGGRNGKVGMKLEYIYKKPNSIYWLKNT